jgi:hypothetical protein
MLDNTSVLGSVVRYGTTWLLTIIACVLFGWVEDLAARRPVRITPGHARAAPNRPSKWLQIVGSLGYLCATVHCCSHVLPSWPQHS